MAPFRLFRAGAFFILEQTMPWVIAKENGQHCVHKQGQDGGPTGPSLGCHGSAQGAKDQLAALYANARQEEGRDVPNPKRSILQRAVAQFVTVVEDALGLSDDPAEKARAVSDTQLIDQVISQVEVMYPDMMLLDVYYDDGGAIYAILSDDGKIYRADLTISGTTVTVGALREVAINFADSGGGAPVPDGAADPNALADPNAAPPAAAPVAPVQNSRTAILRMADGRVRWLGVSCTAVINRSGEIDSRALFDSFEENFTDNPKPIRVFYHAGEAFRTGECDLVARDGYTLITSGLYDDSDLARAEIAAREREPEYWGDSIGYDPTTPPDMVDVGEGIHIPVYTRGILREISTLPEAHAAALFTRTIPQEVRRMLNNRQFQALVKLYNGDEEKAKAEYARINPDETNRSIADGGLLARAAADSAVQEAAKPPAPVNPATPQVAAPPAAAPATAPEVPAGTTVKVVDSSGDTVILDDKALKAILDLVFQSPELQAMQDALNKITGGAAQASRETSADRIRFEASIADLTNRLEEVSRQVGADEAVARQDMPARRSLNVTYRPRQNLQSTAEAQEQAHTLAETAAATLASLH